MAKDSFSLKFYPSKDRVKTNGEIPIYVRVTVNRQKVELSTREVIKDLNDWDDNTQRVKHKGLANSALSQIETDLRNAYQELRFTKKLLTAQTVRDLYLGKNKPDRSVAEYLEAFFRESILTNKELSEGTVKNYRATINHVNNYLDTNRLKRIGLREIDSKFIERLDKFLMSTPAMKSIETLKRNTASKYHTKFKVMLSSAVKDGLIEKNPYMHFKVKTEAATRTFLTRPELDALEAHSLHYNSSLIKVRDVFMFSVCTGLRFTDAISLKKENIEFDGTKYWIMLKQQKTKDYLRIPMLNKAKDIYDKYLIERETTGYILPRITNQKVNAYLKAIADIVGICKPLTHHVARHTNATTIFLANGVPLEIVSKQLGHASIKTTQIYAKITNDMLSKAADKTDEILK